MRAFIAVDVPDEARQSLAVLQRELAASGADVKWVAPEQLHLTLKFLGEITEEQRGAMEAALARIGQQEAAFEMRLAGTGAFPSVTAPRVVWVDVVEGQEPLARIAARLNEEGARRGIEAEGRPFAAHLTLGRVRSPKQRTALVERLRASLWQPPAPWRVESLTFYQSVLSAAGPTYTVLADVPLLSPCSKRGQTPERPLCP